MLVPSLDDHDESVGGNESLRQSFIVAIRAPPCAARRARAHPFCPIQVEPTTTQIVMLVLNYTACIPVLIAVGVFSLFHLWSVVTNTTTIESWEKDRAVSLKRRGKIREAGRLLAFPRSRLPPLTYLRHSVSIPISSRLCAKRAGGVGRESLVVDVAATNAGRRVELSGRSRHKRVIISHGAISSLDELTFAIGLSGPAQQLEWPPRDEFAPARRTPARRPPPGEQPFTYGSGLNPALLPSRPRSGDVEHDSRAALNLPSEGLRRRSAAPETAAAHDGREASDSGSSYDSTTTPGSSEGEDDDEDDVPLGQLAARKTRQAAAKVGMGACTEDVTLDEELEGEDDEDLASGRGVRIRRGSEGYEIRPRGLRPGAAAGDGRAAAEEELSDEWEQVGSLDSQ